MNAILMELSIASLFLLSFLTFPKQWLALEISLFILMSMIALMVDIKRTILPDTLTLGGIAVALVGALLNPERSLVDSAIGLFTGGALLAIPSYLFYIVKKVEGIGGGDIKMLAWVGALIGAKAVFNVLLVSCIIGTLSGLILYYVKKREGRFVEMELAFGPYIAISTYVYALFDSIYFF